MSTVSDEDFWNRTAGLEEGARGEVWSVDLVVRGSVAGASA